MLKRQLNTLETKKYRGRSSMALSLYIGSNKKLGSASGSLVRILQDVSKNLTDDISKKYEVVFGNTPRWRDWVIDGAKAEEIVNNKLIKSKAYKGYRKKISDFLRDAWKERYREIIDAYAANVGSYKKDGYRGHYLRKKRGKDFGGKFPYGGSWMNTAAGSKSIKYVTPGLMTGFLRESISDAIDDGVRGNTAPIKFSNTPLQIASISNIEDGASQEYMNAYYFWNRVRKGSRFYGGVSKFRNQRMFELNAHQMRDASQIMSDAVVKDFLPELRNILSDMKARI